LPLCRELLGHLGDGHIACFGFHTCDFVVISMLSHLSLKPPFVLADAQDRIGLIRHRRLLYEACLFSGEKYVSFHDTPGLFH
jgi:hypothetical protein